MQKGETTQQPVQSQYGWHVIHLEDIRTPTAPAFEDVKQQVEMLSQRKKLQAYLDELRKTAKIQKTELTVKSPFSGGTAGFPARGSGRFRLGGSA